MDRNNNSLDLRPDEISAAFKDSEWANRFPPILSLDQAAELLQIPKATLYGYSSRGLLRGCAKRVGKHLRVYRDRLIPQAFNEGF